jgi:hypothetical protein
VPTGGFAIRLQGERNQVYSIEFSADLHNWMFLHNLPTDNAGEGVFVDRSNPAGRASLLFFAPSPSSPTRSSVKTTRRTLPRSCHRLARDAFA